MTKRRNKGRSCAEVRAMIFALTEAWQSSAESSLLDHPRCWVLRRGKRVILKLRHTLQDGTRAQVFRRVTDESDVLRTGEHPIAWLTELVDAMTTEAAADWQRSKRQCEMTLNGARL